MNKELLKAKRLLEQNGYAVIRITNDMNSAIEECTEMQERGEDRDCYGCPCSICIFE